MNFIHRIRERFSNIRLREKNKPPPPPENNSEFLFERVISIFQPKRAVSDEEEKAIQKALSLVEVELNEEVEKVLDKLRKFERLIFQEAIILFVGLVILLILHGAYDQLAGWIGILLICRVVEQLAKLPQFLKTPQFKSFVRKVYLYLPENKFKPILSLEKAIQQIIRERIDIKEVRDKIKTKVDEKIKSLKLPEWFIHLLLGKPREEITGIILERILNQLVPTISKQVSNVIRNIIGTIVMFIVLSGLIRFFALEITGISPWHFLFFGVTYFIIWIIINYWIKIKVK